MLPEKHLTKENAHVIGKPSFFIPLLLIALLNLFCAFHLQLYADEAYYWMYSQRLDWGYFDHPPMAAFLIRIGQSISGGEVWVRLPFVVLTTASYGLLYILVRPRKPLFFWMVVLSLFPLHLLGFMALPDVPLFFFNILFFITYKRYLESDRLVNVLFLVLTITGMLYSKYHGILIVAFTMLSNPAMLRKRSFYLVAGCSVLLFLPHIWWQVAHDFVSLKFHFFERVSSGVRVKHVLHYLVSFFLFNGPFVFAVLAILMMVRKSGDAWGRALKFNLVGFFIFFLASSLKGRVEANWMLPVLIPAVLSGYRLLKAGPVSYTITSVSLVLILGFRLYLLYPQGKNRALEFHGHEMFARQVKVRSEGLPLVATRYQEASLLSFYLQEWVPVYSENSRKSQFDLWDDLRQYAGETVIILERVPEGSGEVYHPYFGWYTLKNRHLEPFLSDP